MPHTSSFGTFHRHTATAFTRLTSTFILGRRQPADAFAVVGAVDLRVRAATLARLVSVWIFFTSFAIEGTLHAQRSSSPAHAEKGSLAEIRAE